MFNDIDRKIATRSPTLLLQTLPECDNTGRRCRIALGYKAIHPIRAMGVGCCPLAAAKPAAPPRSVMTRAA